MADGLRVAQRAFDAESEQVAGAADVAAGCVDLLKDAVFSQCLGPEIGGQGVEGEQRDGERGRAIR
jgi:hypothetical protein